MEKVTVIGGGLAGSECALALTARGVPVRLVEQRPGGDAPAHHTDGLAELVCSNSLKSTNPESAAGILKGELHTLGSRLLPLAEACAVPAGGALAVDRAAFSRSVTEAVGSEPLIELVREEATFIPDGPVVVAAGPLCSDALFSAVSDLLEAHGTPGSLSFFDAAAPIVDASTIDRSVVFTQSRYGAEGEGDYLNCPLDRGEYEAFVEALVGARRVVQKDFEQRDLFRACQPAEEVARTGVDSLRYGAMKPVGLVDPRTGSRPWAALQLRAENAERSAYNLVGFSMVPGLENAEFFRYGVMHRNTFIDAPRALDRTFRVPGTRVRFAGQICGTEGYVEAVASGLLAALNTYADLAGAPAVDLPRTGALGSLVAYATDPATVDYQPMHVNFGLVPPLDGPRRKKRERYAAYAARARADLDAWVAGRPDLFPGAARP